MKPAESTTRDGGPAFPHSFEESGHPRWRESQGMTLRDYFAAQALAGICANPAWDENGWLERAYAAFQAADAMIEHRALDDSEPDLDPRTPKYGVAP